MFGRLGRLRFATKPTLAPVQRAHAGNVIVDKRQRVMPIAAKVGYGPGELPPELVPESARRPAEPLG